MKKIILIALVAILFSSGNVFATHLMGGEITWECLPNGQFRFYLKVYRDCNSNLITIDVSNGIEVFNYPTPGSPMFQIPVTLLSQMDISPQCNVIGPSFSCNNPGGAPGAVEEFIFQSAPVTLTGTPPAQGWVFSFDGCCRNGAVTNIVNAGNEGFTLRAKMFSFNGMNANPCYDSSPAFAERPSLVSCAGYGMTYNHSAFDREGDSLSYSFSNALDDFFGAWSTTNPPALAYTSGYSANSPLPGVTHDPSNVPAQLDVQTGEMSFLSYTQGNFVTDIKVEAWKCGVKVAEIYREIQVTILAGCASNPIPSIQLTGNSFVNYSTTVAAGDLVTFTIDGTDPGFLPNGNPQSVIITATGDQFGSGFTDPNSGCENPPCAVLSAPAPVSGINSASTTFTWQTDCGHVNTSDICGNNMNTYYFVFKVTDDFCPLPGEKSVVVSITVEGDSMIESPDLRCLSVLPNGDVELNWIPPVDTLNAFNSYHIYSSSSASGPYSVQDSIFNFNATSYTHVGAGGDTAQLFYLVRTRSSCVSSPTEALRTIMPVITDPGSGVAHLSWNAISNPLPPSTLSGYYRIYRMLPGQSWTLIDSTQTLSYDDTVSICNDSIYYRIEIADNSGCVSVSSTVGDTIFGNVTAWFNAADIDFNMYNFNNLSENATSALWDFGDGSTSQLFNPTHVFPDSGAYIVTLIAWNDCDTDTCVRPLFATGINEIRNQIDVSLYPDPASGNITINTGENAFVAVKIVNTLGELLYSAGNQRTGQLMIDISQFPAGLYHVLLEDEKGNTGTKKFVIAR